MAQDTLPFETNRTERTAERQYTDERGNEFATLDTFDMVTEIRAVDCPECGYDRARVERSEQSGLAETVVCIACDHHRFPYEPADEM